MVSVDITIFEHFKFVIYQISLYELGESHYQKGNLEKAHEAMRRCNKFSGYLWEDPLKVK